MLRHLAPGPVTLPRVVILGGSGFIGAALGARAAADRIAVVSLSSRDLDLSAADAGEELAGIVRPDDALVFTSAITREKGRDAATMLRNLAMGERVCTALTRAPVAHVVYLSSDAVFSDDAPNPVSEATPCDPADLYGVMHLGRERMLQQTCRARGVPLAVIRPSIVYGPGDTHGSYGPNRFFRSFPQSGSISLFGNGEERRDHLFIDDLAEILLAVLRRRSTGVLNVATGRSHSFAEVARVFADTVGPVNVERQPRMVPLTHREYDVTLLRSAFPDFVPTPLEAGLRATWAAMSRRSTAAGGPADDSGAAR